MLPCFYCGNDFLELLENFQAVFWFCFGYNLKMTVYFDLDRVLADFGTQAKKYGILKRNNRVNWFKVFILGSRFWSTMDFFPGAEKAFSQIHSFCMGKGIHVKILSSVRIASGKRGKIEWCREKLHLDESDVIIVKSAVQKSNFASADSLLIDDNEDNIRNFTLNGGHAFEFSSWNDASLSAVFKLIEEIFHE
jgi:5'(3')-deoxyribonucleotidase